MKPEIYRVSNSSLMQAFQAVPALVYGRGNIPPSADRGDIFSPLNPSLRHIKAAGFVAFEGSRPVGRICASVDSLNPRSDEGFWGCFECAPSPEATAELITAAAEWLRKEDKTVMTGPATLNTNQTVGLLIRGFNYPPQKDIPFNPPYYRDLIEEAGLKKAHDLECFNWELPECLPPEIEEAEQVPGLVLRPVNYSAMAREAGFLQYIHNTVMTEIWGHIPITFDEAAGYLSSLVARVPPELFIMAEIDGEPAGLLLSIPGLGQDSARFIRHAMGGIVPEFRGRGIPMLVLRESYRQCKRYGFTRGEGSQVAESNDKVKRRVLNPIFGGEIIKVYRVYKKYLD